MVTNRPERSFTLIDRMEHYGVPGVGIAVIRGGEVAWARGYGVADKESGQPVDEETLFRTVSISKPVSAAGALRLVEQGILDLDVDVTRQLRSWQIPESEYTTDRAVTLRHLLSHTGGISDDPELSYRRDEAIPTLLQVLEGSVPARVDTVPGSIEHYSNQGYCLVQLVMSDQTGRSFPALMDELVLGPVGMVRSTFRQNLSEEWAKRASTGYLSTGEELPDKRLVTPALAAAGLWSTPSDLARFAVAIQRSYNGADGSLLSRDTAGLSPPG